MTNLEKLQALLTYDLDALLLTSNANRQYATGAAIDEGMLLITDTTCLFITDSRYLETAQNQLPNFSVKEVNSEHSYYSHIQSFLNEKKLHTIGIEEKNISYSSYLFMNEQIDAKLLPCQNKIDALRSIKEPWELEIMQRAQDITDNVFADIIKMIQPNITEKELEAELIYRMYRLGAQGLSFQPIVVSGPNTSMPHGVAGNRKIQVGDFVTMDFGIKYEGYCSDMTRTIAVGKATDTMKKVYETVLLAQTTGISATFAGKTGREIDGAARKIIVDAGYGSYFGHSYGHGLGLEIHEAPNCSPSNNNPIPAYAVVSAEPGIYLPGQFGVRIEDVVIVTESGALDITHSTKELLIL